MSGGPHALLWSGGKDSALALDRARRAGIAVGELLTFGDEATERVRFHATPRTTIEAQVRATVVGAGAVRLTAWDRMPEVLEQELARYRALGYEGVVLGDIHLADVRAWYEERVMAAGLAHVEPLWGDAPEALLREFVDTGGRAVVTCVDTRALSEDWLGRIIDERFVEDVVAAGIDACGEKGEYHSFAFAGPAFTGEVAWTPGERRSDGRFAQLDILTPPG